MTIQVGDKLPSGTLQYVVYDPSENALACGRPISFDIHKELAGKTAVIFAVPGAFTSTCSEVHLPGYLANYEAIKAKGVNTIVCVATNDAFVMHAWAKMNNVKDHIIMASDPIADWVNELGLKKPSSNPARSQRFAIIARDLVVEYLGVEGSPGVTVSGAETVLAKL